MKSRSRTPFLSLLLFLLLVVSKSRPSSPTPVMDEFMKKLSRDVHRLTKDLIKLVEEHKKEKEAREKLGDISGLAEIQALSRDASNLATEHKHKQKLKYQKAKTFDLLQHLDTEIRNKGKKNLYDTVSVSGTDEEEEEEETDEDDHEADDDEQNLELKFSKTENSNKNSPIEEDRPKPIKIMIKRRKKHSQKQSGRRIFQVELDVDEDIEGTTTTATTDSPGIFYPVESPIASTESSKLTIMATITMSPSDQSQDEKIQNEPLAPPTTTTTESTLWPLPIVIKNYHRKVIHRHHRPTPPSKVTIVTNQPQQISSNSLETHETTTTSKPIQPNTRPPGILSGYKKKRQKLAIGVSPRG